MVLNTTGDSLLYPKGDVTKAVQYFVVPSPKQIPLTADEEKELNNTPSVAALYSEMTTHPKGEVRPGVDCIMRRLTSLLGYDV